MEEQLSKMDRAVLFTQKAVELFGSKWVTRAIYAGLAIAALCAVSLVAAWSVRDHYRFTWNLSDSLPQHFFVIEVGVLPQKGDFVAFTWKSQNDTPLNPYPYGTTFVKILEGMPGSLVEEHDRNFSVDGKDVGYAKILSKRGLQLNVGRTGVIPPDHYYVRGLHRDSLDSRYELLGLVKREDIIGRAIAVF